VVLPYKKASQSGIIPISFNYNKLILTSNIAGLKEFVVPGKTGYLFDTENPNSLSVTLSKIYYKHDFKESDNFISVHKEKFTIDKLADDIISFIK